MFKIATLGKNQNNQWQAYVSLNNDVIQYFVYNEKDATCEGDHVLVCFCPADQFCHIIPTETIKNVERI